MSYDTSKFEIREVGGAKGKGLYAMRDFAFGEYLLDYTGEKITAEHADTLGTKYLFEIDDKWTIDGEAESNTARYINHSCDPNVEAQVDEEEARIMIHAARDIEKGEELLIDYGDEYFDEFIRPYGCMCGTAVCRQNLPSTAVAKT
jgi:SET domain-containing protein